MKIKTNLYLPLILTLLSFNTYAWELVRGDVSVTNKLITLSVYNSFNGPIQCKGTIFGRTNNNQVAKISFQMDALNMNFSGFAYLTAYGYSYFIQGNAEVYCRLRTLVDPMEMCLIDRNNRCLKSCAFEYLIPYNLCNSTQYCQSPRQLKSNLNKCNNILNY